MRAHIVLVLFALFIASLCRAQEAASDTADVREAVTVQEMPEYRGGMTEMYKFIRKHTKYPKQAFKAHAEGRIYVEFVVAKDGAVTDVKIKRGGHPALETEAMRVVASMPPWQPGKLDGKPVNCRFVLPIDFKLNRK